MEKKEKTFEEIHILTAKRTSETKIPQEFLRHDDLLVEGIHQYCEKNNLKPIYIDACVAIFDDHYLIPAYKEEY